MEQAGEVRRVKLERWSPVAAMAVSVVACVLLLLFSALIPLWLFESPGLAGGLLFGVIFPVICSYFLARGTYRLLRWRVIEDPDGRYCDSCAYDLTGNTSGVCPECGVAVLTGEAWLRGLGEDGTLFEDDWEDGV